MFRILNLLVSQKVHSHLPPHPLTLPHAPLPSPLTQVKSEINNVLRGPLNFHGLKTRFFVPHVQD